MLAVGILGALLFGTFVTLTQGVVSGAEWQLGLHAAACAACPHISKQLALPRTLQVCVLRDRVFPVRRQSLCFYCNTALLAWSSVGYVAHTVKRLVQLLESTWGKVIFDYFKVTGDRQRDAENTRRSKAVQACSPCPAAMGGHGGHKFLTTALPAL